MIQSVTGAFKKENYGKVLIHEHIACIAPSMLKCFGQKWLDLNGLVDFAADILSQMNSTYGLGLFVDGTPIDTGRDVRLLKAVSEKSGIPIVASTGLYWFPGCETLKNEVPEIASWCLEECKNGMEGTGIRPGILKCATGPFGLTEENRKRIAAMGIVQRETGLPLYVHCEHQDTVALGQIDLLLKNGANPEKIIIGHGAIRPDSTYMESILKTGVLITMDQCRSYSTKMSQIAECILSLCNKGYADKILLSNDHCIYSDFRKRTSTGLHWNVEQQTEKLGYLFREVYQAFCSIGGKQELWDKMTTENALHVLDV